MMISLQAVTFGYPGAPLIFDQFNWEVTPGETWTVLGPSGCGKTTLLYLLAGLFAPGGGNIVVGGQPLSRPRPRTGLILQDYGLLPWATVRANAALGLSVRNFYGPDGTHAPRGFSRAADVDGWLVRLGLADVAGQYPARISGGQRQRTAIARTLVLQPDLLLMDEPFSSLDAVTREDLQNLTVDLCAEEGITLIMVTHAIEEAATVGEKILVLSQPPHKQPVSFDNPGVRQMDYRQGRDYFELCQTLRHALEGQ
jgi:ABC-type nitrate/sulfonate/bicarbonate transport system ATPase subunit